MDVFATIRGVRALEGFDDDALRRLVEKATVVDCSGGEVLFAYGAAVDVVGIVTSGRLEAVSPEDDDQLIAALQRGDTFGEISLLTGEPALATLRAAQPSRVVLLPQAEMTQEIGRNPIAARPLAKLLAERMQLRERSRREREEVERARIVRQIDDPGASDTRKVLVLNLGSSSVKYALLEGAEKVAHGLVDRIGLGASVVQNYASDRMERQVRAENHEEALRVVFDLLVHPEYGPLEDLAQLTAVGHRVVHGGARFSDATVVDQSVTDEIRSLAALAPLHNPVNLKGIELCEKLLPPELPQVCVFDTAFHVTMPSHAHRYALPEDPARENQLRRYGFHGTSHKYVAEMACASLGQPLGELKLVTCHLGNGASVTAVDHGRSVDTSMGLTPLEGLVMGTRAGDVDPGLVLHLIREGMDVDSVDRLLNKQSGLLGLSGLSSDMRELESAADNGHEGALLAIATFCYRVRKYIGAYAAAMGGLDGVVFTGGIGENSSGIRTRICQGLGFLGVEIDEKKNVSVGKEHQIADLISQEIAPIKVLVVPTDEERMIAKETLEALARSGVHDVLQGRRDRPLTIGVSARHVHLSREDVDALFGEGHELTPARELNQPGQYACAETVDLVGPKGRVNSVRVLGPLRSKTQVEISRTEEFKLGIDAPVRASGDVGGTPSVKLVGSKGEVTLNEGLICALRHIHMSPEHALAFGLRDKDVVRVRVEGERSLIFGDVLVRVNPGWNLEMHLDTDEANAAELSSGMKAHIESVQRRVV